MGLAASTVRVCGKEISRSEIKRQSDKQNCTTTCQMDERSSSKRP
ncbi:unnamed protein product [Amoebophrya sp. A25]|nr:unnamed protein product [Amoebophrya sp. A25]|eukprot:GSA25T00001332001.1